MVRGSSSALKLLKLMMVCSLALPAILFCFTACLDYRSVSSNVDERLLRTLDVLEQQAKQAFQGIELALNAASDLLGGLIDEEILGQEGELRERLLRITKTLPPTQTVWAFSASGHPLVTTYAHPVSREIDNSNRDYFRAQLEEGAPTFIGSVIQPRLGDRPIFTVSHRRTGKGGTFLGVIAAAIVSDEFTRFYGQIGRTAGAYAALMRRDGIFLARFPEPVRPEARLDENSVIRKSIVNEPGAGRFNAMSQLDSIERRIVYRALEGYPVYVMAGIETSAIWREWWSIVRSQLAFGVPATAIVFAVLLLALRRTQGFFQEATRRQHAEAALRQSQKLEAVGQLTGGIAHDFNNLLMVIEGNLSRLRKEVSSERAKRAAEAIGIASERGKALTSRLLGFSRQQPLAVKTVDVGRQLSGMQEMLRRTLPRSIEVKVDGGASRLCADIDPGEFELAILNLAVNARDAMPDGGVLEFSMDCRRLAGTPDGLRGEFVAVRVRDTGAGISAENLPRIFDPFFTTKEFGKGTGLGLSQVYGFCRQSGGTVTVESEVGAGASFCLYIPRSQAEPARAEGEVERPHILPKGLNVLLVEDNPDVAEATSGMLGELACNVTVVASAILAKERLGASQAVDFVFSDIVMPGGLDGIDLARYIRRERPELPVVLATGYSDRIHEALSLGVSVLAKPFSAEALKGALAAAFRATVRSESYRQAL